MCEAFDADSADDLLHILNRSGAPPSRPGPRLTPIVLDEADRGDVVAGLIVRHQAELIGAAARLSAERVGLNRDDRPLVLGGGVFRHPSTVLAEAIAAAAGASSVTRTTFEPAVGALLLAFDLLKIDAHADEIAAGLAARVMASD